MDSGPGVRSPPVGRCTAPLPMIDDKLFKIDARPAEQQALDRAQIALLAMTGQFTARPSRQIRTRG